MHSSINVIFFIIDERDNVSWCFPDQCKILEGTEMCLKVKHMSAKGFISREP